MINASNSSRIESFIDLEDIEIVGIMEYEERTIVPSPPVSRFFMDEIDHEFYFSPKTSAYQPTEILQMRAKTNDDIFNCILFNGLDKLSSLSEANAWLCRYGLDKYRFVTLNKIRNRGSRFLDDVTVVDDNVVCHIGSHYIWVKDLERYVRPEMDILRYDLRSLAEESNWTSYTSQSNKFFVTFAISVYSIITNNGVVPYMIAVYPEKCFVDLNDPQSLIREFANWLSEEINNNSTVVLVGFMNEFLDDLLLKYFLPPDIGWTFVEDNIIVSIDGYKIHLVDAVKYSCDLSLECYCLNWGGKGSSPPRDLITLQEAKSSVKSSSKAAVEYCKHLYAAFASQEVTINTLMSPLSMVSFSNLDEAFIMNILLKSSTKSKSYVYLPVNHIAKAFLTEAIRPTTIETIGNTKSDVCFTIDSLMDVIISGDYPLGKPRYVSRGTPGKLYISLCEIKRREDIKIPIVFSEECPLENHFDAVLTSVDIDLLIKIGGYKIREFGAIEWETSTKHFKTCTLDLTNKMSKLNTKQTDKLLEKILVNTRLFSDKSVDSIKSPVLFLLPFIAGYCRRKIHSIIEEIDSHFLGDVVTKHDYRRIWIDSRNFKTRKTLTDNNMVII